MQAPVIQTPRGIWEWKAPIDYGSVVFHGWGGFPNAGTFFHDAGARKNNGTLVNGPTWQWVPELGKWGIKFIRANSTSVLMADADYWSDTSRGFSIAAWVKRTSTAVSGSILDKYNAATGLEWIFGFSITNGRLMAWVYDSTLGGYRGRFIENGNLVVPAGDWYQVCWTYDGGTATTSSKIYVNGVQRDTNDFTAGNFTSVRNTATPVSIGRSNDGVGGSDDVLAGVMHVHGVLSPSQIQWLANRGNNPWQPWRRKSWAVVGGAPVASIIPRIMRHRKFMGVS